jgi:glycine betaine/proline transport system ATP-binding protein
MTHTHSTRAAPQVSVHNVWKVFGAAPERAIDALDAGATKSEVMEQMGAVAAVRDVSFDVLPGETFVVMGLSGSGKSTLLRCLPRLIEPTRGQILVDGRDVAVLDKEELRDLRRHRMSMVFQHFGLFPHRRIIDNVAYGLEVQGVKKAQRYDRARRVLELVNLQGWENHYPSQLSGGMQQRVGLARALAVDPEILLFDEPFSALDPLIRREMQDELLGLQARMRKTLVFITHDFAEAIKLGTHIAIMKDGAFVQVGTAEDIVLRPADQYVTEFTRDVPKAQVLTARSIMRAAHNGETAGQSVAQATRLDRLIPLVMGSEHPLPVVDEGGAVVGCVDRGCVLRAMALEAA